MQIGDKVIVTDGSSDGHTGRIVAINSPTSIRIERDADGIEVEVSNFTPLSFVTATNVMNAVNGLSEADRQLVQEQLAALMKKPAS